MGKISNLNFHNIITKYTTQKRYEHLATAGINIILSTSKKKLMSVYLN